MNDSTEIVFWITSLVLSIFFSGMETAFISSDKLLYALDKKKKTLIDYIQKEFYNHPRQFLSALTIGNLIVMVVFVYFTISLSHNFVSQNITDNPLTAIFVQFSVASIVLLFTGELLPRAIFRNNANMWVKILSLPAFIFYILLYPIVKAFTAVGSSTLRLFGIKFYPSKEKPLGRLELNSYVKQGVDDIPSEEEVDSDVKIFRNALDFSSVKLRDCIVPRTDIVAVSKEASINELKERFIETGYSKILVYEHDIDNIIGYIHIWEMFDNPPDWPTEIASISFYPDSMLASNLLTELLQQHKTIAVVVDEFGGTSGIITMEDLVEEIFGEIEDEYDVNTNIAKKVGENEYIFSGRMEIDQLNELFDLSLPEEDDYTTIAGFILHHMQRFPNAYETIEIDNYIFKILKVTQRRIEVTKLIVNQNYED